MKKSLVIGAVLLVLLIILGISRAKLEEASAGESETLVPMFEVDPFWPRPLPHHWLIGSAVGVTVDSRDHIFIIHRPESLNSATEVGAAAVPPTGDCCIPAPHILEFDPAGNLVGHFGGPGEGYDWPETNHGITADPKDNLWIGGSGADDSHVLVFSREGKFLHQFGSPRARRSEDYKEDKPKWIANSHDRESFGLVTEISFSADSNEAFVADGYLNTRVAVLDATTGEFKRYWGAYGNEPNDEDLGLYNPNAPLPRQFRSPVHCAEPSLDDLVYVCDRSNNRIQVFELDGTFVKEKRIAQNTLAAGSVWDIAFSKDPKQQYMFVADGQNMKVYVLDRESLEILTSFGDGGRQPGQFFGVHNVATDSKGNIYTVETYEGKRLQKFVYKGLGSVNRKDQGVLWPSIRE
jgi:DNA-binding beta-propeller fold protein YncE